MTVFLLLAAHGRFCILAREQEFLFTHSFACSEFFFLQSQTIQQSSEPTKIYILTLQYTISGPSYFIVS